MSTLIDGRGDTCRSCGEPIVFALTRKGRRIPLNPEPTADGNVTVSLGATPAGSYLATVWGSAEAVPVALTRYTSHFATCPDAPRHRRSR